MQKPVNINTYLASLSDEELLPLIEELISWRNVGMLPKESKLKSLPKDLISNGIVQCRCTNASFTFVANGWLSNL